LPILELPRRSERVGEGADRGPDEHDDRSALPVAGRMLNDCVVQARDRFRAWLAPADVPQPGHGRLLGALVTLWRDNWGVYGARKL
jgi:hypothetical protein